MNMIKKNWSDFSDESFSEEAIRAQYRPQAHFKIYVNTYAAGTSVPAKAGHTFVLHVLAGNCKISHDGNEVTLSAAEWIKLEKGSYTFDVVGDAPLKLVKVFSLS